MSAITPEELPTSQKEDLYPLDCPKSNVIVLQTKANKNQPENDTLNKAFEKLLLEAKKLNW